MESGPLVENRLLNSEKMGNPTEDPWDLIAA